MRERPQTLPDLDKIIDGLSQSPYTLHLQAEPQRRQMVYEQLSRSADPVLREIGEQLRIGAMTPRDILRVSEYAEAAFGAFRLEQRDRFLDSLRVLEQYIDGPDGHRSPNHQGT